MRNEVKQSVERQVIKTCPFCGKKPKMKQWPNTYEISCRTTYCVRAYVIRKDKQTAMCVWNKQIKK